VTKVPTKLPRAPKGVVGVQAEGAFGAAGSATLLGLAMVEQEATLRACSEGADMAWAARDGGPWQHGKGWGGGAGGHWRAGNAKLAAPNLCCFA